MTQHIAASICLKIIFVIVGYYVNLNLIKERINNMSNNKKYFIIEEQRYSHIPTRFDIKYEKMFDYETAITKMFHLNALNEDKENKIYHLQEVLMVNTTEPFIEAGVDLKKIIKNGASANE